MPTFITIHRAPGVTREEVAQRGGEVLESKHAKFLQNYVNLADGFIVTVYEATDQAALEREYERLGFPFDEIHEVQFGMTREGLAQRLGKKP